MTPSSRRPESLSRFTRSALPAVSWLVVAMALLPSTARAQERQASPTISSDRPGLGDGAYVLVPGEWQVELGGTVESGASDSYLLGSSLMRIGLPSLELRLYLPNLVSFYQDEPLRLGDLGLGAKVPLSMGAEGWRWSAEGVVTLPTGARALSAGDPGVSASMLAETDLGEGVVLALNAGYGFITSDAGAGTLSLLATPTFPIPGHEGLSAYAGYAAYLTSGEDAHYLEAGLARLDGADRQWDVNTGWDPHGHAWFVGVGVAQRWR